MYRNAPEIALTETGWHYGLSGLRLSLDQDRGSAEPKASQSPPMTTALRDGSRPAKGHKSNDRGVPREPKEICP